MTSASFAVNSNIPYTEFSVQPGPEETDKGEKVIDKDENQNENLGGSVIRPHIRTGDAGINVDRSKAWEGKTTG